MDVDAVDPGVVTGKLFRQRVVEAAEAIERRKRPSDLVAAMERDGVPPEQALAAVSQAIHAVADSHRIRSWVYIGVGVASLLLAANLAAAALVGPAAPWSAWLAVSGHVLGGGLVARGWVDVHPEWSPRHRRVLREARSIG
jgi:hypothetical protein